MKTELQLTDGDGRRQCRGVLVHEDLRTELRGRRLWNQLVHDMGYRVRCDITCRSAEWVKESLDFDGADQTDIVIIAVRDLGRFFFAAAGWLNDWLSAESRQPRALFVLHEGSGDSQVLEFLRTITDSAGVTLFSRGSEAGHQPPAGVSGHEHRPAECLALAS